MKYGKGVNAYVKLSVRENGKIRTLIFDFPYNKESFDRPEKVFYDLIAWYRTIFPEIDATNMLWCILKFDNYERNKIISYILTGAKNGKMMGETKHAHS